MPRLRRGVELNAAELAWLSRALTIDQRYALIDAGWGDDLGAAVDFAVRHSPVAREAWEARQEVLLGWGRRGFEDALLQMAALRFWDGAVPVLVANGQPSTPEPAPPAERVVTSRGEGGNRGGRSLKEHPGLALHEAAHLIRVGGTKMSNVKIAAAATSKARAHPEITEEVIASHKWETGMHYKQVPRLRQAIKDRLVQVTGGAIRVRSKKTEPWRALGLLDWAEIPRLEIPPLDK